MASFLDCCRFIPASNGAGSFVVASAVGGYQTPASANAVSGATYRYRAESADLTQWEVGFGVYTAATATLTRSTILFNSSGGTSAINFTAVPQVAVVVLAEDLLALVPGQIPGTATNDSAATGNVGEYVSATFSSLSLSNVTPINGTSISLTAGDWDVTGTISYSGPSGTVVLYADASVSSTTNTEGNVASFYGGGVGGMSYFTSVNASFSVEAPVTRFSLSATTTIYLVAKANFSVSTLSAAGTIRARRVR
jgi:hypothetical protein